MKVIIVPVAAGLATATGLAAAAGLAITGACSPPLPTAATPAAPDSPHRP